MLIAKKMENLILLQGYKVELSKYVAFKIARMKNSTTQNEFSL